MECTGACEDCRQVVKNVMQNIPDVVLMDIDMPPVNGIEGVAKVGAQAPTNKL